MAIVIAGTPGVGKTTLSSKLAEKLGAMHIEVASFVKKRGLYTGYDEETQSYIVDEEGVRQALRSFLTCKEIVDTHIVTCIPKDKVKLVIVLRLNPLVLMERLQRRGYKPGKVRENVEAEILGTVLADAVNYFGERKVREIDVTGLGVDAALDKILSIIRGGKAPPGTVDWLEKYWEMLRENIG